MTLLLDTHVLLWAVVSPEKLSGKLRARLDSPREEICYSTASLWEIAIKSTLGRTDFSVDVAALRRGLLEHGYREVPISGSHAIALRHLPHLHKDPFDRMLIAQAQAESVVLLTHDAQVARYPGPIELV
ncbi:MAG: type II toxin-antitoxin system VapC family toxin [Geminicoccaceae bacterium]|nr:type II toxin-antitoxin system VapC family toxin [Geminicoccaceae bacterium]